MDLFDFVNLAADMGLDGVELTSYYFPTDVTPEYLHRLCSTPSCSAWISREPRSATTLRVRWPGPRQADGTARELGDRAAELDVPVIRIFADRGQGG